MKLMPCLKTDVRLIFPYVYNLGLSKKINIALPPKIGFPGSSIGPI